MSRLGLNKCNFQRWLAVGSDRRIVCEINGAGGRFMFRAPSFSKTPYSLDIKYW